MEWLTNEILLYGGLGLAAISVIALIICLVSYKFRRIKLFNQLDKEYGEFSEITKHRKKGRRNIA